MRTHGQPDPITRARLWWNGRRDARGGLMEGTVPPRAAAFESAANARCCIVTLQLERGLEQPAAALARLHADRDCLSAMLAELPELEVIAAPPATAVDATAVSIRANARTAEQRLDLTERVRRLEIEAAGLEKSIDARKRAAQAQRDAEIEYGKVCRDIYLAAFKRYALRQANSGEPSSGIEDVHHTEGASL
jgi:hypothetical protein